MQFRLAPTESGCAAFEERKKVVFISPWNNEMKEPVKCSLCSPPGLKKCAPNTTFVFIISNPRLSLSGSLKWIT